MKDHTKYAGRVANVTDEGTGLNLPECFLTVEGFNLYPNSLNFGYGDYVSKEAFDNDKSVLGLFRKFYPMLGADFQAFQTEYSQVIAGFMAMARSLCNAPEDAEFIHALINPTQYKINFLFRLNGQYYTFIQDEAAYLATVESDDFTALKDAMYAICLALASAKTPEFWNNTQAV